MLDVNKYYYYIHEHIQIHTSRQKNRKIKWRPKQQDIQLVQNFPQGDPLNGGASETTQLSVTAAEKKKKKTGRKYQKLIKDHTTHGDTKKLDLCI